MEQITFGGEGAVRCQKCRFICHQMVQRIDQVYDEINVKRVKYLFFLTTNTIASFYAFLN